MVAGAAASEIHELTVGVAAHQKTPRTELHQAVQHLHGHRAGCMVAGDDDQFSGQNIGLGQHRIQDRQDAVDIGQDSNRSNHEQTVCGGEQGA